MTAPPRKPFWKRKRWIAAAVLWLAAISPLSTPPVMYLAMQGWLPMWAYRWAYWHFDLAETALAVTPVGDLYQQYFNWWFPIIS